MCKRYANLKESSSHILINSTYPICKSLRKFRIRKYMCYTSMAVRQSRLTSRHPWNAPLEFVHPGFPHCRQPGQQQQQAIWAGSRSAGPCSRTTDDPERLKVDKLQPEATVLWTLAHSESAPTGLLPLALILQFSKDCEILTKVTRQIGSDSRSRSSNVLGLQNSFGK